MLWVNVVIVRLKPGMIIPYNFSKTCDWMINLIVTIPVSLLRTTLFRLHDELTNYDVCSSIYTFFRGYFTNYFSLFIYIITLDIRSYCSFWPQITEFDIGMCFIKLDNMPDPRTLGLIRSWRSLLWLIILRVCSQTLCSLTFINRNLRDGTCWTWGVNLDADFGLCGSFSSSSSSLFSKKSHLDFLVSFSSTG